MTMLIITDDHIDIIIDVGYDYYSNKLKKDLDNVLRCDFNKLYVIFDFGFSRDVFTTKPLREEEQLLTFIKKNKKITYMRIKSKTSLMQNEYNIICFNSFPRLLHALDRNNVIKYINLTKTTDILYFNKYIRNHLIVRKWFYQVYRRTSSNNVILFLKN